MIKIKASRTRWKRKTCLAASVVFVLGFTDVPINFAELCTSLVNANLPPYTTAP